MTSPSPELIEAVSVFLEDEVQNSTVKPRLAAERLVALIETALLREMLRTPASRHYPAASYPEAGPIAVMTDVAWKTSIMAFASVERGYQLGEGET